MSSCRSQAGVSIVASLAIVFRSLPSHAHLVHRRATFGKRARRTRVFLYALPDKCSHLSLSLGFTCLTHPSITSRVALIQNGTVYSEHKCSYRPLTLVSIFLFPSILSVCLCRQVQLVQRQSQVAKSKLITRNCISLDRRLLLYLVPSPLFLYACPLTCIPYSAKHKWERARRICSDFSLQHHLFDMAIPLCASRTPSRTSV